MTIHISKRVLLIIAAVIILAVGSSIGVVFALGSGDGSSYGVGTIYKVTVDNDTYYPDAYGIKSNGTLRMEIRMVTVIVREVDRYSRDITPADTKILEIPAGKWKLWDLTTGKQIKTGD